jgi:putative ABC transport system permease protein
MAHLERVMKKFAPGEPFEYAFLDDTFDAMYRTEERLSQIFTSFAGLAIFIACLGLFGLAAFAAEIRTKEIGIRKVLGASVPNIVALLSREFVLLVAVAFVVAAPVAYLAMDRWLADFAYRIAMPPTLFAAAGLLALSIALATVSYQALKAALADPVKALRYE